MFTFKLRVSWHVEAQVTSLFPFCYFFSNDTRFFEPFLIFHRHEPFFQFNIYFDIALWSADFV